MPNTTEEWEIIEHETRRFWQFLNCIGAADGKHVVILHPSNSGSEFYNYKGFFQSFYLLLLIITTSSFLPMLDVKGELVMEECTEIVFFYKVTQENLLELPPDKPLPVSNNPYYVSQNTELMPYVFLADDAFPLGKHCLKPYSQSGLTPMKRVFNYRLSRFRRVTENAFGILTNHFRVFTTKMYLDPDKATTVNLASLVLHNTLRQLSHESYTPYGFIDMETSNGEILQGNGEKKMSEHQFYKVYQIVTHEKQLSVPKK